MKPFVLKRIKRFLAVGAGAVALGMLGPGLCAGASAPALITFDVPGATLTGALSINPAGAVTGYYLESNSLSHGFVRTSDGALTTFDGPGATFTFALEINPAGVVTGWYRVGSNGGARGFQRAPDGTFTGFGVPGAIATYSKSINPAGVVTGNYVDSNFVTHGFLRIP